MAVAIYFKFYRLQHPCTRRTPKHDLKSKKLFQGSPPTEFIFSYRAAWFSHSAPHTTTIVEYIDWMGHIHYGESAPIAESRFSGARAALQAQQCRQFFCGSGFDSRSWNLSFCRYQFGPLGAGAGAGAFIVAIINGLD
jgi:hypothetical protein